jgi:hypothetical protein
MIICVAFLAMVAEIGRVKSWNRGEAMALKLILCAAV